MPVFKSRASTRVALVMSAVGFDPEDTMTEPGMEGTATIAEMAAIKFDAWKSVDEHGALDQTCSGENSSQIAFPR